ncbi:hypothetical protein ACFE04_023186 [Oxalis oulophora]
MAKKNGPCNHCGTYSTPMWRNGPIEKPVLCNACGTRYKNGNSLENYVPKNVFCFVPRKRCVPSIVSNEKIMTRTQRPNNSTSSSNVLLNTYSAILSNDSKIFSQVEVEEHRNEDSVGGRWLSVVWGWGGRWWVANSFSNGLGVVDGGGLGCRWGGEKLLVGGDKSLKVAGSWALNIPTKKRSTRVMFSEYEHIRHLRRDLYNILVKQGSSVSPELDVDVADNSDNSRYHEMWSGAKLLPPAARKQKTGKCSK